MQPHSFLHITRFVSFRVLLKNEWLILESLIRDVGIESQLSVVFPVVPQLSYKISVHFAAISSKLCRTQISAITVEQGVISQMTEITNSHWEVPFSDRLLKGSKN